MDSARIEAMLNLNKKSTQDQHDLNEKSLTASLDAADRIIMRKAADAAIQIASTPQADPT